MSGRKMTTYRTIADILDRALSYRQLEEIIESLTELDDQGAPRVSRESVRILRSELCRARRNNKARQLRLERALSNRFIEREHCYEGYRDQVA